MIYADYDYYVTEYLGGHNVTVPAESWTYYARQASTYLDNATNGRIDPSEVGEAVMLCCCELTELLYRVDSSAQSGAAGPLASYSNDGQSGTFVADQNSVSTEAGKSRAMMAIASRYLGRSGMLYRGGGNYAVKS